MDTKTDDREPTAGSREDRRETIILIALGILGYALAITWEVLTR